MRRAVLRLILMSWLACVAAAIGAVDVPMPEVRFRGFLDALGASDEAQRAFVEHNFTERLRAARGVDKLVEMMRVLHADLGSARPLQVMAAPDKFEALFKFADRDERVLLTLRFGAGPGFLIDAVMTGPVDGAQPDRAVAEAELPAAVAGAVSDAVAKGFSGAVLVARNGKTLVASAHGDADRAQRRAITLDTPINLGSCNKMFTALVIARLVEQGKLHWSDTVGAVLPQWPQRDVREQVTVDELLDHTSGLGEYWGPEHDARRAALDDVAAYAKLIESDAPASAPGSAFRYSNNGYVLLGLIAEKLTGKDYYALVRELVYKPAGMSHSDHYRRDDEASGRAVGYDANGHANTDGLAARGSPAGGGYASANDLLRFAEALLAGRIVKPETLASMTTKHAQMGPHGGYGYGFGVFDDRERHFGHNGGAPGINASFEVFPDSGYLVIVLANSEHGAVPLAMRIGNMILTRT